MAEMSPAAAAVRDHFLADIPISPNHGLAAALEALDDQVVPETDPLDTEEWLGQSASAQADAGLRFKILRIAAELRGGDNG